MSNIVKGNNFLINLDNVNTMFFYEETELTDIIYCPEEVILHIFGYPIKKSAHYINIEKYYKNCIKIVDNKVYSKAHIKFEFNNEIIKFVYFDNNDELNDFIKKMSN